MYKKQKQGVNRNKWTSEEDEKLMRFMENEGLQGRSWDMVAKLAGLERRGRRCRERWKNWLEENVKTRDITEEEANRIYQLQQILGYRWAEIARHIPGRRAMEIKNYWYYNFEPRHHNKHDSSSNPQNYIQENPNSNSNPQSVINLDDDDVEVVEIPPPPPPVIINLDDEEEMVEIAEHSSMQQQRVCEPAAVLRMSNELVAPEHNFPDDITEVQPLHFQMASSLPPTDDDIDFLF